MQNIDIHLIQQKLPIVVAWLEQQENEILSKGRFLTPDEIGIAQQIGVKNPDIIKVNVTNQVPLPNDHEIQKLGFQFGLFSTSTLGISFRYGIFINATASNPKEILAHELIHTLQYERLGSIELFIAQYLSECLRYGYNNSPLEKEAREGVSQLNF